jgi:TatD DNase family protein
MLIDTHCHLDAVEFDRDRAAVIDRAGEKGVGAIVIPAVGRSNFTTVRELAHSFRGGTYALGIHPLFVPDAHDSDLEVLNDHIQMALDDPRFVAIGEIGLDFYVPALKESSMQEKQEAFYEAQLDMAQRYGLPVLLHVRRSQDRVLKYLRTRPTIGGIAHAFNGSYQQAEHFIEQGFALGIGGAMTFERALQIRRLSHKMPLEALVLETDAPDIPPAWLRPAEPGHKTPRNEPCHIARIAKSLAELRGLSRVEVVHATAANAKRVLPRLAAAVAAV